jgi:hypothetical protein
MKFDHLDKTKDLAHRAHPAGGLMAHKALKAHTFPRTLHGRINAAHQIPMLGLRS